MAVKERWRGARPIGLNPEEMRGLLRGFFQGQRDVEVVYLFGSWAKGNASESSDIDLGIVTKGKFSWEDYYELCAKVAKLFRSDRFDLIWLNRADPVLKFLVIKEGEVLFYRDPDALNDYEFKAKGEYYDYTIYLQRRREE